MIRPSSFNIFLHPTDQYLLRLYNTASRQSLVLKHSWESLIKAASVDNELRLFLLEQGFLTRSSDYAEECFEMVDRMDGSMNSTLTICYTITLDCSFHCPYCFQRGQVSKGDSKSVISRFLSMLEKELSAPDNRYQKIDFILFGGDPMLDHQQACLLLDGLQLMCSKHDIELEVLMTTNGVIGDRELYQTLAAHSVNSVMLSFDGNREIHDITRENSFMKIMGNLPMLSEYFFIVIKYNFHGTSIEEPVYLDFLSTVLKVLRPGQFRIAFEALHPTGHEVSGTVTYLERSPKLAEKIFRLHTLTREQGVNSNIDNALHPPCPGLQRNTILVLPEGELIFCNAAIGIDVFSHGNIQNSTSLFADKSHLREIVKKAVSGKCEKDHCAFFPVCQTGCLFEKHLKNIPLTEVLCEKEYIEAFMPYLFDKGSKVGDVVP